MKITVIMASHNRVRLTVVAIARAQQAADFASLDVNFIVFDDGSTDNTVSALASLTQQIHVMHGDGNAYWAKGMANAEHVALNGELGSRPDYLVWLNDDVSLDLHAFAQLTRVPPGDFTKVLVGAMRDPVNEQITYSGFRRSGAHPLRFALIEPTTAHQAIDTFNGNFVLVPTAVAVRVGGIDGSYSHALADIDYGLRCARLGIAVVLMPGTHGTCARNDEPVYQHLFADWVSFVGIKGGGNFASLRRILRKSNPCTWAVFILISYALWWSRRVIAAAGGKRSE